MTKNLLPPQLLVFWIKLYSGVVKDIVPLQNTYNCLKTKISHSEFLYIWLAHGQETQLRTEVKNKRRSF